MDVVFVALGLGCFAVAAWYVRGCDRMVGREHPADTAEPVEQGGAR